MSPAQWGEPALHTSFPRPRLWERGGCDGCSRPPSSAQLHGWRESEPLTLQLFIGTADDRAAEATRCSTRCTDHGKTVSTASHEAVACSTKVPDPAAAGEQHARHEAGTGRPQREGVLLTPPLCLTLEETFTNIYDGRLVSF